MKTNLLNGIFDPMPKPIPSPISAFNNSLKIIVDKLMKIYSPENTKNLSFINSIIFDNKSINIGTIKLFRDENGYLSFNFFGKYTPLNLHLLEKTLYNQNELEIILNNYLFLICNITGNFDSSICEHYLNNLYLEIISNKIDNEKINLIPYKRKINHLYDNKDKTIDNLYNRYSYLIRFNRKSKMTFTYKIVRALSSELNQSKSIDNIRFVELDIIKENTVTIDKLKLFLTELYYYGNIIY